MVHAISDPLNSRGSVLFGQSGSKFSRCTSAALCHFNVFLAFFPGALVFTSIGAGLGDIFARGQTPDLAVVWEPQIILPILGLCLLSALPVLLKILRGKKGI